MRNEREEPAAPDNDADFGRWPVPEEMQRFRDRADLRSDSPRSRRRSAARAAVAAGAVALIGGGAWAVTTFTSGTGGTSSVEAMRGVGLRTLGMSSADAFREFHRAAVEAAKIGTPEPFNPRIEALLVVPSGPLTRDEFRALARRMPEGVWVSYFHLALPSAQATTVAGFPVQRGEPLLAALTEWRTTMLRSLTENLQVGTDAAHGGGPDAQAGERYAREATDKIRMLQQGTYDIYGFRLAADGVMSADETSAVMRRLAALNLGCLLTTKFGVPGGFLPPRDPSRDRQLSQFDQQGMVPDQPIGD